MSALKLGKWHLSLAIVFVILGVLLSTSFYVQRRLDLSPGPRRQKLVDFIEKQERQRQRLEYELKLLRNKVGRLQQEAAAEEGLMGSFGKEMAALKEKAGLTPIQGRGVEVIISDATRVPANRDPNYYLVHDYDLQIVINALWRGGAKAVAMNGQRFISTTAVRCAGAIVMVNAEPLGTPYKILAIGDPKRLLASLNSDSDAKQFLQNYAKTYGMGVSVKQADNIELPAYQGSLRFDNIKVVRR